MLKRRRPYKQIFIIVLIGVLLAVTMAFLDSKLRGVFYELAEVKATQLVTQAIQESLQEETMNNSLYYQDMIRIHKNNEGAVTLMQADTLKVNAVSSNIALAVQNTLEELKWHSFGVPVGQALGIPVFANSGPKLRYKIMQVGSVKFNITEKFESAGINQTKHTIYLQLDTNVRIVVPAKSGETLVSTQIPLVENIVVGEIPDAFITWPGATLGAGLNE